MSRFTEFLNDYRNAGCKVSGRYYGTIIECSIASAIDQIGRRNILPKTLAEIEAIVESELELYSDEQSRRDAEYALYSAIYDEELAAPTRPERPAPCKKVVVTREMVTRAKAKAMALDVGFDLYSAGIEEIIHEVEDAADRIRFDHEMAVFHAELDQVLADCRHRAVRRHGRFPKSSADMTDYDLVSRIVAAVLS